ncbi:MAG: chloride channel protein [Planctomycetes bacterium]|nr:chloride channel protein [Planctomycetota bacterium]
MYVRDSKRLIRLVLLAAVAGLMAGGAAYVLLNGIGLLTNLAWHGRLDWSLPSFAGLEPSWRNIVVPVVGAALVTLLAKWSPIIRGHGIPEAMEAILRRGSRIQPRAAVAKPLSAAIAIGTGGPFGAEGPIIVTGGSIGSLIGQLFDVSASERKILLASGAAAGMAATFGAPLASVVIALELLLFEFSTRAFIPLVVAVTLAAGVHSALFGHQSLFSVPAHEYAGIGKLPFYLVLGLACGLLATLVTKGLFLFEHLFRKLPVSVTWHPLIGAIGFGIIGVFVPRALGVGYDSISDVLAGTLPFGVLLLLFGGKLLAWWIALASGTSGGTLAPVLLTSGTFGGIFGILAERLFPGLGVTAGAAAVVAMAATFGAATRATFTSIVFLFELTGDYQIILPLMLASAVADLVTFALLPESLMTEKLARRGLRVTTDIRADVLEGTRVREIMTPQVITLGADSTVGQARALFAETGHSAYPLVEADGRCVGIVRRRHLGDVADDSLAIRQIARMEVVSATPEESADRVLLRMVEEDVDHLPVLDGSTLVGICTRTDLMRAKSRDQAVERREPGWISGWISRRRTG